MQEWHAKQNEKSSDTGTKSRKKKRYFVSCPMQNKSNCDWKWLRFHIIEVSENRKSGDTDNVSATRSDIIMTILREPASCARSRLSDLNKSWTDQVLSVLNRLQPFGIYNESVFIFSLRALRAEILREIRIWNFY